MKRHSTKEAFYQRLQELAEVNKPAIKESKNRALGTLIDYKRAADGVAYGIIKENHNYYIKKAGTKQDPNVSDFAYIGGLSNITDFQYSKLSEADKQRNMIFHTINEAVSLKPNKNGGKKKTLNEDIAKDEIDNAESKLGDLDAATSAEATPEMPVDAPADDPLDVPAPPAITDDEPPAEEPVVPDEAPATDAPVGDEEVPADDTVPEEEPTTGDEEKPIGDTADVGVDTDEPNKDIEKVIGKLTNKIRKTDMTDAQVKSYINSFLVSFKDKLPDIEIEDRKKMADKLIKIVGQEDIEDLEASMPDETTPEGGVDTGIEEEQCAECGGFGKYAESRGYGTPESFMECDDEEKSSVVSGYANAHNDGQNDGDLETVGLVIKLSPEILEKLKGDYGHDEYAEKLTPYADSMNETTEEDAMLKLNELWGGLGALGKAAAKGIGGAVKGAGQAIGGAVKGAGQAIGGAAKSVYDTTASGVKSAGQAIGQAGQDIKQAYNKGEINPEVKKLESVAANLGKQIAALNKRIVGAGQQPINVKSILATIQNQLGGAAGAADLSKFRTAEGVVDMGNVEVQPNMLKEDDEPEVEKNEKEFDVDDIKTDEPEVSEPELEKPEELGGEEPQNNFFATPAQSLGGGVVKPDGAPTTAVDVSVDAQNKTVNVTMNEAKRKLIKQIAEGVNVYMSEISPVKKLQPVKNLPPVMNESEKKLRKYIRTRLEEKAGKRKPSLNESKKSDKLKKLDEVIDKQFKLYESVVKKKKK